MNRIAIALIVLLGFAHYASADEPTKHFAGQIVPCKVAPDLQCRVWVVETGDRTWRLAANYAREFLPLLHKNERDEAIGTAMNMLRYYNPGIDLEKIKEGDELQLRLPYGTWLALDEQKQKQEELAAANKSLLSQIPDDNRTFEREPWRSRLEAAVIVLVFVLFLWEIRPKRWFHRGT